MSDDQRMGKRSNIVIYVFSTSNNIDGTIIRGKQQEEQMSPYAQVATKYIIYFI